MSQASDMSIHEENDVEELEMLLEAYIMQIDSTLNKLATLELFLSSGTVCLSVYSIAAVFGMNIPYTWRDNHAYLLKWVIILAGMASGFIFFLIVTYARLSPRSSWDLTVETAMERRLEKTL